MLTCGHSLFHVAFAVEIKIIHVKNNQGTHNHVPVNFELLGHNECSGGAGSVAMAALLGQSP